MTTASLPEQPERGQTTEPVVQVVSPPVMEDPSYPSSHDGDAQVTVDEPLVTDPESHM